MSNNNTNTSEENQPILDSSQEKKKTQVLEKKYQCQQCIENTKLSLSANKEADKDMQEYFDDPFEDWYYPSEDE